METRTRKDLGVKVRIQQDHQLLHLRHHGLIHKVKNTLNHVLLLKMINHGAALQDDPGADPEASHMIERGEIGPRTDPGAAVPVEIGVPDLGPEDGMIPGTET